ncbi:TPA: DEAD/DEAH box helicase family protein [Vibrio parahaemolyticus]|uniref:DEAD/DEAH box helicase n=1 Tax=Vibrio parahaemolyticus TaxID=670 RepID=UPI0009468E31|nr:DEAD/DEAH box helicase family protein [Vibrio parahaemolyticus]OLF45938.1 restriction endonuclease subunit R [Vibrio parahaemolyticus]HCM1078082.1 DEAD/DEAH box helicase family protein [Vibrio parahaemolyticus]
MFTLKKYQKNALSSLRDFLTECRSSGDVSAAFSKTLVDHGFKDSFYRDYKFTDTPYVCIRIPTGGGKTVLGTYAITTATQTYLEKQYPFVLWLVPTKIIKSQTVDALNKKQAYREHLMSYFNNDVLVVEDSNVDQIRPQDIGNKTIVVVSTIANLRVEDTADRKAMYGHREEFEGHFSKVDANLEIYSKLEKISEKDIEQQPDLSPSSIGQIKGSFANLMCLSQPLVIVDEAHNARTELTFETLQRVNPSAIIEFTATPNTSTTNGSNVLFHVSASELKAEDMIKLPIMLTEHTNGWEEAVQDSILTRERLELKAQSNGDTYIRPIVLFQAENKDKDITVEVLVKHLKTVHKVTNDELAIVTGTQRELDGIDLFAPDCKVKYVVTIDALKEGWDCSFAYVFCSVKAVTSTTAAEQLLGRVLRMPYAKRQIVEDLNRAYAHLATTNFATAANSMKDSLISMGFEQLEVDTYLRHMDDQGSLFDDNSSDSAQPASSRNKDKTPSITTEIKSDAKLNLSSLTKEETDSVSVLVDDKTGTKAVTVKGTVTDAVKKVLQSVSTESKAQLEQRVDSHNTYVKAITCNSKLGIPFKALPQLCIMFDDNLEVAEHEILTNPSWSILDHPTQLDFQIDETSKTFSVDIGGKKIVYKAADQSQTMNLDHVGGYEISDIVHFLINQVEMRDRPDRMRQFLNLTVKHIVQNSSMTTTTLHRHRYPLARALDKLIQSYHEKGIEDGYQQSLFGSEAHVETSYDITFEFKPDNYPARTNNLYDGSFQFSKHYYPIIEDLKEPSKNNKDSEFLCAQCIDSSNLVKHWVRNLDRRGDASFRLPKPDGTYFYPDFIAELENGRFAVIEYKGEPYKTNNDSAVKRQVGELWASKNSDCIFAMIYAEDECGQGIDQQIQKALNSK